MIRVFKVIFLLLTTIQLGISQGPKQLTSGEIYEALEQFNFLGNALYIAAHPDDENTRLISYLVNEVNAHTTYLSLTRGDGGQNLIGPEISELLGVIRTQELLAARRTDGGHQMFTRANDFGYSKTPDETINIWDDDLVKHDVVWAIRKLRPDIIINRFDHSGNRKTHGHHTASAMLSYELFEKANDPNAYPEQLKYHGTWSPSRLFFNTSWWFFGSREKFEEADKSDMLSVDIGTYYPLLGKSNNEIAAQSRSNHKCQGFGSTGSRGSELEYVKLLKGDMPSNREDLFGGINTTWSRVKGGEVIKPLMDNVMNNFNHAHPERSIKELMTVYKQLDNLKDDFWKNRKKEELTQIIKACLGLYTEAIANKSSAIPGDNITVELEVTKRLQGKVDFIGYTVHPNGKDTTINISIGNNEPYFQNATYDISIDEETTAPYWLKKEGSLGMYNVDDLQLIGLPETPRDIKVTFKFDIEGVPFEYDQEVAYKYNSPEDGEVFQPFEITPELFVDIENKVYIFADNEPKPINVVVTTGADEQSGYVTIPVPDGWSVSPEKQDFSIKDKGASKTFIFQVTPPTDPSDVILTPNIVSNGKTFSEKLVKIDYPHIPLQTVLRPAKTRVVKIDIDKRGNRIAYVMGAGDDIPNSIKQIGYQVVELNLDQVNLNELKKFDALILGVRAYNTLDDIKFKQDVFMEYVEQGGTMLVQYNTNRRLKVEQPGPYPLNISRDRVTVEGAEIRILKPEHEVLNYPNKITSKDFEGWVQERGLYFPDEWDEHYEPILSSNDPDETPKDGGLLIAKYGKGYYIYSGYSWFRQLPAGVPGAYRLFANILSLGNETRP